MKFKYTGSEKEQTIRGIAFAKGKPVEVDAELAEKLTAHPDYQPVRRKTNANKK
mgnify:CR=1 FL=1